MPLAAPKIVVARLTSSDGVGGTYNRTFSYSGARFDSSRFAFVGFQRIEEVDSRTQFSRKTYYEQEFPYAGLVRKTELLQSDGTMVAVSTADHEKELLNPGESNNQRYFAYVASTEAKSYEIGGPKNGELITTATTVYSDIDYTYGNIGEISTTLTDNDSTSPFTGNTWTTVTTRSYQPADTSNWCLDLFTQTQVQKSSTGLPSVTRTVQYTPDVANCRVSAQIIEPSSSTRRVDTAYGHDDFGNIDSTTVTGRDLLGATMPERTSSIDWGTRGQFPVVVTDALGHQTVADYDYDLGLQSSSMDPNGLQVFWDYDSFGRRTRQTRPDQTSTTWSYENCSGSCLSSRHRMTVVQSERDIANSALRNTVVYLDQLERPLVTRTQLMNGPGDYQWSEVQYDALGRVVQQSIPCASSGAVPSCVSLWAEIGYDALGRVTWARRPINATDTNWQTTSYQYAGRMTTVTDPHGKVSSQIMDVSGRVRRTIDANGYYQALAYDAAGSLTGVTDSLFRPRFTAEYAYGAGAFQTTAWDPDRGSRTQAYDSLGQLRRWADANGQTFYATYDELSRTLTRTEPDTSTGWVWGSDAQRHNIGRLEHISSTAAGDTYSESYDYDDTGRIRYKTITVPGDASYRYDFAYDASTGLLNTLTYPEVIQSAPLTLKYNYNANGFLSNISDANAATTVFWNLDATNARGQVSRETLGNGVIIDRAFDPVTGWLSSIRAGTSGSPTSIQNAAYLYDLMGNLTQRQNNRPGPNGEIDHLHTEDFYYGSAIDNLYRLSSSGLDGSTNLSVAYDELGNIVTKSETGNNDPAIGHTVTWSSYNYPTQIQALGETATFAYGPERQRWRMVYTGSGGSETTYYIGGLMEKVVTSTGTEYRHAIAAGARAVAIYSVPSGGTSALRYVLTDHQGSVETITGAGGDRVVHASFSAFGNRRNSETWSGPPIASERSTLDGITRQAYTFQTVLGSMGLNHLNGRVQDAITGRFLSPDPFVPDPANTQSFNRYSYVYNNPLSFIDPSGFTPQECESSRGSSGCSPAPEVIEEMIVTAMRDAQWAAYWTNWDLQMISGQVSESLGQPSVQIDVAQSTVGGSQGVQFSSGVVMNASAVIFKGPVEGVDFHTFGDGSEDFVYEGTGYGLDLGASLESVWAIGSGAYTGETHSININYGPLSTSYFWTPGPGGWNGITFGLGVGLPGIAFEQTNYRPPGAK